MNADPIQELIPAYALGALDADEREEEHLDQCPRCTSAAREYLEATSMLASVSPAVEAPPRLKAAILGEINRLRPVASEAQVPVGGPIRVAGRPRWQTVGMAFAATLAVALVGGLLGAVLDLRGDLRSLREDSARLVPLVVEQQQENERLVSMIDDLREESRGLYSMVSSQGEESQNLATMIGEQRTFAYTMALPGTEAMVLENTEQAPDARGMLMVSGGHTWALLVSQGLETQEAMGYQLWVIRDGHRSSGGVFTVDSTGYGLLYVKFPAPLEEFSSIGITMEPEEGSPGPTGMKVLETQLN